jgi:hypothetical protein
MLGTFKTKAAAKKHEKAVQYLKWRRLWRRAPRRAPKLINRRLTQPPLQRQPSFAERWALNVERFSKMLIGKAMW